MKHSNSSRQRRSYATRIPLSAGAAALTLATGLALPPAATAQTAGQSDLQQLVEKLSKQVQELQSEVKDLKSQSAATAPTGGDTAAAHEHFPDLQFHGFMDVTYTDGNLVGNKNAFALGEMDLFVTSRLTDDLSMMAETVVAAGGDNEFTPEIERVLLQYKPSDYFNIDVGRYHTSLGFYSTAYHHGTYLQTATGRPGAINFEDSGGIFPIHNTGISINGAIPSGKLGLHYIVEVGNGRPYNQGANSPVLNVSDNNEYKAVNLGLSARPEWAPGLQFGVSAYHDTLTPDPIPRTDQQLYTAHVVYQTPDFEFLNEVFLLRDHTRGTRDATTPFAYTQLSKRFDKIRPYVRFQYLNVSKNDQPVNTDLINDGFPTGLQYGPSFGVRYDFTTLACVKLQYDYFVEKVMRDVSQVTLQLSYTF